MIYKLSRRWFFPSKRHLKMQPRILVCRWCPIQLPGAANIETSKTFSYTFIFSTQWVLQMQCYWPEQKIRTKDYPLNMIRREQYMMVIDMYTCWEDFEPRPAAHLGSLWCWQQRRLTINQNKATWPIKALLSPFDNRPQDITGGQPSTFHVVGCELTIYFIIILAIKILDQIT